jgi:hypothetical protein
MNIPPPHLDALQTLGYTEAEARFLYIVATYSGYFLTRQFLAFAGAHRGQRPTRFARKLEARRHVRTERFPKSGVVHQLCSRRLYRLIERENLHNRRAHEIDFIKHRFAILDFVLTNQGYQYLETEPEKVRFFSATLNIDKEYLPAKVHLGRAGSPPTVRYFVDEFPMFLVSPSPVVTFTYIHEGKMAFTDFIRHLKNYLPLFRRLSEFRLIYASRTDWYFEKAREIFDSLVKIPLESDITDDLLRYFRVCKAWDEKQYATVSDADLIFRNQARNNFGGDRFEALYRGWKNGRVNDGEIRQEVGTNDRRRTIGFETQLLRRMPFPGEEGKHHRRRNHMPIVTKAPGIMTREVQLEEPVNELLEDYARFIESTTDHVINVVLKKVLWRDRDYRKWRSEGRKAQPGSATGQPTDARARA